MHVYFLQQCLCTCKFTFTCMCPDQLASQWLLPTHTYTCTQAHVRILPYSEVDLVQWILSTLQQYPGCYQTSTIQIVNNVHVHVCVLLCTCTSSTCSCTCKLDAQLVDGPQYFTACASCATQSRMYTAVCLHVLYCTCAYTGLFHLLLYQGRVSDNCNLKVVYILFTCAAVCTCPLGHLG